jgi:hypothetical protein
VKAFWNQLLFMPLSVEFAALLMLSASLTQVDNLPVTVVIEEVESIGGEVGFCPGKKIQQALFQQLSNDSKYRVQTTPVPANPSTVVVTGSADCSLSQRVRKQGFLLFQEQFTITTANVSLQLQLVDPVAGKTIHTIQAQGQAQSEVQTSNALGVSTEVANPQAESLFSQATTQAVEQAVLQLKLPFTHHCHSLII